MSFSELFELGLIVWDGDSLIALVEILEDENAN
jgi:hypothetical protein